MEISDHPFDNRFHAELSQLEATDPEVEKFFFDLGSENKQPRKNLMIEKKYRELLTKLKDYNENQILQYASVFLQFGTDAQLYTGILMKKWKEQQAVAKKTSKGIQKGVLETVRETV